MLPEPSLVGVACSSRRASVSFCSTHTHSYSQLCCRPTPTAAPAAPATIRLLSAQRTESSLSLPNNTRKSAAPEVLLPPFRPMSHHDNSLPLTLAASRGAP
eukprot:scaffold4498_cov119-Isochrysis_galbana.AAC.48